MESPMLRLISWIIMAPAAAAVVLLSISNRDRITLNLDPLPYGFDLPVIGVILGAVAIGFVWGAFAAWVSGAKTRRLSRQRRFRAEEAERDAKRLRDRLNKLETQASQAAEDAARKPVQAPVQPGANLKSLAPPVSGAAA